MSLNKKQQHTCVIACGGLVEGQLRAGRSIAVIPLVSALQVLVLVPVVTAPAIYSYSTGQLVATSTYMVLLPYQ
jgi:hypothetical protein